MAQQHTTIIKNASVDYLYVDLPQDLVKEMNWEEGDELKMEVVDGVIQISKA